MNFDESKKFVRELLVAFPAFDDAARNTPDIAATHRSWAAAWDDLSYAECSAVLVRLIKSGEIGYEDYRAPGPFVRRLVLAGRKNTPKSEADIVRERELTRQEKRQHKKTYRDGSMAKAMQLARQCATKEQAYEAIDRILFG